MVISDIHLQQFRLYTDSRFTFDPQMTVITGKNGVGKTNILEAIYILGYGKSFRDSDEHLLQYDKDWWRIAATIDDNHREMRFEKTVATAQKTFIFEHEKRGRFTARYRLPIVLFEPDDLLLIHGSPARRRAYVDGLLGRLMPLYATTLQRYERALQQRNRLLKQSGGGVDEDALFIWDIALAEAATVLVAFRKQFIADTNTVLGDYYSTISDRSQVVAVRYQSSIENDNYKQALIHSLRSRYHRDQATGFTSVGPHRDDIAFYIDGHNMETDASRGEIRTLLLALKRIETDRYREIFDTTPLFLLDDVFSELDSTRRKHLLNHFYDHQMVVTTTDADSIAKRAFKIEL